jgi:hypothetical protein
MRKWILTASAVFAIGAAIVVGIDHGADAQPAPPGMGPGPDGAPPHPGWAMHMPWDHHDGHSMGEAMHHNPMMGMMRLIVPAEDRALTGGDVQKIAESYLLWNGNRTWKVANVAENQDNTVSFAFAAPDGTVIAKFAVDRKTGHFRRLG